jgi:UDP-N-acetylmuramyl tripeptide synthase
VPGSRSAGRSPSPATATAPAAAAPAAKRRPLSTLGQLFPDEAGAAAGLPVAGLTADSRRVAPGFGARLRRASATASQGVPGSRSAGRSPSPATATAPAAAAPAAKRLSGRQPETVVAVTGTSGKSSVADFVRQILTALGRECDEASIARSVIPSPARRASVACSVTGSGVVSEP